jgi:N-acetylmuramic acid 6-phosphate etherase
MNETARQQAQQYLEQEKAFRLGELTTESFHPKTMDLGKTSRQDLPTAVRMLQSVDRDIPPVAQRVLQSAEWRKLRSALLEAIRAGRKIFFTGCGATGRLSILLEAAWRSFWQRWKQSYPPSVADRENIVFSVMAGGDFALIRSVEGFEDFQGFGRRQLNDLGVGPGDVVVAITEGGETSFVIGTAWEGLDSGASVFFVYNNPTDLLRQHVQRSREIIDQPRITKLDLATGPMAVTGSTRMQATTIELLVVAAALESALTEYLGGDPLAPQDYADRFVRLLDQVETDTNVCTMARLIELERDLYARKGLVTYLADEYMLDVLTDTTERSPTFMIPPFRATDDSLSPRSWAFVKNPQASTVEAWSQMLRRAPRGLTWTRPIYESIGAPDKIIANPPHLDNSRIHQFRIGNEPDPSRTQAPDSAIIAIVAGPQDATLPPFLKSDDYRDWARRSVLTFGQAATDPQDFFITCDLPTGPLEIWRHLALKLVLNAVSTITMAALGRVEGNAMTWVSPSNKKLIDRGTRLIALQTDRDYDSACYALFDAIHEIQQRAGRYEEVPSPVAVAIQQLKSKSS